MYDLQYPIGEYSFVGEISKEQRAIWIEEIASAPAELRAAVAGLIDEQLDTPYRPEGWTIRQVVHHVPDSHLNAYIRFKWTLTEDSPTIKAYHEDRWAELPEAKFAPLDVSLDFLDAIHRRWGLVLRNMSDFDFGRSFTHPELDGPQRLDKYLGAYAWHGKHHIAHITSLKSRKGW